MNVRRFGVTIQRRVFSSCQTSMKQVNSNSKVEFWEGAAKWYSTKELSNFQGGFTSAIYTKCG